MTPTTVLVDHTRPIGFDSPTPIFKCCLALNAIIIITVVALIVRVILAKHKANVKKKNETHPDS